MLREMGTRKRVCGAMHIAGHTLHGHQEESVFIYISRILINQY